MGNLEFAILFVSSSEPPLPGLRKFVLSERGRRKFISVMKFYWNSRTEFAYPRFEHRAINYQQQKSLNDIFKPALRRHRKHSAGRRQEWALQCGRWHDKGKSSISERLLHLCQMPVEFLV